MRTHINRKQLFVRVELLVFLIAAVCLGIFSFFRRLSSSWRWQPKRSMSALRQTEKYSVRADVFHSSSQQRTLV
jgi:hypothetical protein